MTYDKFVNENSSDSSDPSNMVNLEQINDYYKNLAYNKIKDITIEKIY